MHKADKTVNDSMTRWPQEDALTLPHRGRENTKKVKKVLKPRRIMPVIFVLVPYLRAQVAYSFHHAWQAKYLL